MNIFKKIYHLPQYIFWQINLRIPSEETERYNKWQPTLRQSLSEYIDYQTEFARGPFLRGSRLIWGLLLSMLGLLITAAL